MSGYRDTFEGCSDRKLSKYFGIDHELNILRKYRKVDEGLSSADKERLLQEAKLMCGAAEKVVDPENPLGVTFREFVQFVVDGNTEDMHWVPIAKVCDLCVVFYDVIEKFETLERDQHYLLHRMGKTELLPLLAGLHTNHGSHSGTNITRYLDYLDEHLLWSLKEIYKDDFDLFGYKPHVRVIKKPLAPR